MTAPSGYALCGFTYTYRKKMHEPGDDVAGTDFESYYCNLNNWNV